MGRNKTAIENVKVGKLAFDADNMCEVELSHEGTAYTLRFGRMVQPSQGRGRPPYGYCVCAVVNGEVRTIPGDSAPTKETTVNDVISDVLRSGVLA